MRGTLLERIMREHGDKERGNGTALGPRERRALGLSLIVGGAILALGDYNPTISLGLAGIVGLLLLRLAMQNSQGQGEST